MRPELIENPVFLRYYEKWQKEPTSVVFAAISEIFRTNNMLDEAVQVATEGLKHHPNLISGHLALAKAFLAKGEKLRAKDEAVTILGLMPNNIEAIALLELAGEREQVRGDPQWSPAIRAGAEPRPYKALRDDKAHDEEDITEETPLAELEDEPETGSVSDHEAWHTLTMAQILARQGHFARARKIFRKILDREPGNEAVKTELNKLE